MIQSNKYYKSCAVGVTSEVGLTTDRDLSVLTVHKKHNGSHVVWAAIQYLPRYLLETKIYEYITISFTITVYLFILVTTLVKSSCVFLYILFPYEFLLC